jgi:nucleolar protein 53
MGRRLRGAKLRAKKRSTEAAEEIVQADAVQVEVGEVEKKADDELFVLDTTAIVPSKKQQLKKQEKKRKYQASAKEEAQIQKLVKGHTAEELQKLAEESRATRNHAKIKGKVQPTFDLWGQEEDAIPKAIQTNKKQKTEGGKKKAEATRATGSAVSIDVAKSGQSYNPDKQEHKSAIEEALKVETKREHAEKEHKAPVSQGLKPETRALLLGDSDTDDDSDEDEARDDDSIASSDRPIQKRPEKLTRAQRNKQKRHRLVMKEIQERKRQKTVLNAAGQSKAIARKLTKEEQATKERNEQLKKLKNENQRVKGKDVYQQLADINPRFAPTYPVALPSELKQGSLRAIKPKGSLITDRMMSLMDRDMAAKKQLKKKMRVEGKRRHKVKVRGKGYEATIEGDVLG